MHIVPHVFQPSFTAEVGGNFTPFLGFPLDNGVAVVVGLKPILGTGYDLKKLLRLRRALQLGLALTLRDPKDGIVGVGIDGFVVQALIPAKGEGMNDGKKLSDVIGAMNRAIMEYTVARLQIDGLIFHRTRIARAGRIHSPRISPYFHRQGKYGVVAVVGRVLHIVL